MSKISEFVKEKRLAAGLSIGELGSKANVSGSTLYRIESDLTMPSVIVMGKIAPLLGVHINELIDKLFENDDPDEEDDTVDSNDLLKAVREFG